MNITDIIAGIFSGIAGAMGLGGGGILVLYLTLYLNMEQLKAQGINLVFFLPCALISLLLNFRGGLVKWKEAIPIALGGLFGVIFGIHLANIISSDILRKIFAVFLLIVGFIEIFSRNKSGEEHKIKTTS